MLLFGLILARKKRPQRELCVKNQMLDNVSVFFTDISQGSNYSSPSSEATSGADNELSALLKIRQRKI